MAEHSMSYQSLLEQCAQGKPEALQQLYEREAPQLLALGISLLQRRTDAEELVRESFVLIWRNADAYDSQLGTARAWIYSIFRFRAQQRLKNSSVLHALNSVTPRLLIPANSTADLQPFQKLDEKARTLMGMAYLHAYSYAEIAKSCKISIEQTQKQLHSALLALIDLFPNWHNTNKDNLTLLGLYCLGILKDSSQSTAAQHLLSSNPHAAHDLLQWENCFSALTHTLPTPSLGPRLLIRIYQDIGLPAPRVVPKPIAVQELPPKPKKTPEPPPANSKPKKEEIKKNSWKTKYWIIAVALIAILGLIGSAFMPKAPVIKRIEMSPRAGAILQAPGQSSTPAWIVSVDPAGHVLFTPQVTTEVAADKAVQLWTQYQNSTEMRSLGLLNPNMPVTVPQEIIGEVQIGQIFEMTLEPINGSKEPSGPVLFIGRIVLFGAMPDKDQ